MSGHWREDARAAAPWSLVAVGFALLVALGALQGMAHVSDEVAYTLQSRLFAAGMRTGPATDVPSMLDYPFWVSAPASYSPFPPGWPALLAVGEVAGAPWLVNALLAGAVPLLVWGIAREWAGTRVAELAAVAAGLSPQLALLAGSRMAHVSVVVGLGVAGLVVLRRRDPPWAWLGAGLGVAYVVTARPFDAALLGGPLLVAGLLRAPGHLARLALVLPAAAGAAVVFADNIALTGHALQFPMSVWLESWAPGGPRPGCNALGFGADVGCMDVFGERGHTPAKALRIGVASVARLDKLLLGIPGGLVLGLIGWFKMRRPAPFVVLALVLGGYALYWSPGLAYGARFYAPLLLLLPIGVAVVLGVLPRWFPHAALVAVALVGGSRLLPTLADDYWCVGPGARRALEDAGVTDGVVLLDARGTRPASWPALGVPGLTCDAMLSAGSLFQDLDPTSPTGGLQPRYMLADPAQVPLYLRRHQPGVPAVALEHDVAAGTWSVRSLPAPESP